MPMIFRVWKRMCAEAIFFPHRSVRNDGIMPDHAQFRTPRSTLSSEPCYRSLARLLMSLLKVRVDLRGYVTDGLRVRPTRPFPITLCPYVLIVNRLKFWKWFSP